MAKKEKINYAEKGDKVTAEYCPSCNEELVIQMDGETEVFECTKCKFKIKKK